MFVRYDPRSDLYRGRSFLPADAYRKGDDFYLHIDIPGIDPDSIDVSVEKKTLTVSAERFRMTDSADRRLISERPSGSFSRKFFLGDGLDTESIDAQYQHGVLTLVIPVSETAQARKISITTPEAITAS